MHEKIVEIIVYLMTELRSNHPISETTVRDLSNQGYTPTEISAAFSWLADKASLQEHEREVVEAHPHSVRLLHEFEQMFISPEVYGYLLQLYQLSVVSHDQMEMIIERCMMSGMQPVDMDMAKSIVASLLFTSTMFDTPGQRLFLHASDTIH
jgi:uncharacterized protein Smg (DUF494 family)